MKDHRLYQMKHRAERDKRLSHAAHRLLAVLISDRYTAPHFMADDEFPLPVSTVRRWLQLEKDQSYHWLGELITRGYIRSVALRGCPATKFYKFEFTAKDEQAYSSRENPATGYRENPATSSRKKPATSYRGKPARHISSSLREELLTKEAGKGVAAAPGKKVERAAPGGDELKLRQGESVADFQRRCKTHYGLN